MPVYIIAILNLYNYNSHGLTFLHLPNFGHFHDNTLLARLCWVPGGSWVARPPIPFLFFPLPLYFPCSSSSVFSYPSICFLSAPTCLFLSQSHNVLGWPTYSRIPSLYGALKLSSAALSLQWARSDSPSCSV